MSNLDHDLEDVKSYQKEIADLTEILNIDPLNIDCLTDRADFYYLSGQIAQAIQDYETAVSIDPNEALIYQSLAVCYAELDEFEKASEYCRKALKLEPELMEELLAEPSLTHIAIALELENKIKIVQQITDTRGNLNNTVSYFGMKMLEFRNN